MGDVGHFLTLFGKFYVHAISHCLKLLANYILLNVSSAKSTKILIILVLSAFG